MEEITPRYLYPVIQEGIKDGSIVCEHPMEVAESLAVLANVWMNPKLKDYGIKAHAYHGNIETLKGRLNQGNPVIALTYEQFENIWNTSIYPVNNVYIAVDHGCNERSQYYEF